MILDAFAGPGGWSEGLRSLGLSDVGIEWDAAACATRGAAGHPTIRADVEHYPTGPFAGKVTGLIASPPCQDFSVAGARAGIAGDKGRLVVQALRWALALRPEWVAFKQVPPVLPIWELYAHELRQHGYSVWTGILCAADYGVPQTRHRAFLIASRVAAAVPPEPTHAKDPTPGLFGTLEPWVTMADALGWGLSERPAFTYCGGNDGGPDLAGGSGAREAIRTAQRSGQWSVDTRRDQRDDGSTQTFDPAADPARTFTGKSGAQWVLNPNVTETFCNRRRYDLNEPAPAVVSRDVSSWAWERPADDPVRLTVRDALILQGFDPDYPVQGSKTKQFEQIGNAVPPPLAAAVIGSLVGTNARQDAA